MTLRVEKSLADLVKTVTSAGYQEMHRLSIEPSTLNAAQWGMYIRNNENGVVDIAYVSDSSEIILRQAFSGDNTEDPSGLKHLENMLEVYVDNKRQIAQLEYRRNQVSAVAGVVGAFAGLYFGRLQGLIVGGAAIGGLVWYVMNGMVKITQQALDEYMKQKSVIAGQQALESIEQKQLN